LPFKTNSPECLNKPFFSVFVVSYFGMELADSRGLFYKEFTLVILSFLRQ
jgi:hypothetical protein